MKIASAVRTAFSTSLGRSNPCHVRVGISPVRGAIFTDVAVSCGVNGNNLGILLMANRNRGFGIIDLLKFA